MLKQVIEIMELLDSAIVDGQAVEQYLRGRGIDDVEVETILGAKGPQTS